MTTDYLLLASSEIPKPTTITIPVQEQERYYKDVKVFDFWQVSYLLVVALIYFIIMGSFYFPEQYTLAAWLSFFLLVASATAIKKSLNIKEKYLNHVIGIEEQHKNENKAA